MESYWGASGELVGSYGKICQQCCSFQDKLLTHEDVFLDFFEYFDVEVHQIWIVF